MDRKEEILIIEEIKEIRKGNQKAFAGIFERYREMVLRHIRNILQDQTASEDALQETFIKVWQKADQLRDTRIFKSWLFRIATNTAINHLRSRRKNMNLCIECSDSDDEEHTLPAWMIDSASYTPEELLILREKTFAFHKLIDRLPPEKKEVIRLVHQEDMSIKEASEALGVPEGTVKSRLHYALKWIAGENSREE